MANLDINTNLSLFVFNVIKGSHVGNKLQVFMIRFIGSSSFKKTMTIEMEGFPQGERPSRK
jgi:enolase